MRVVYKVQNVKDTCYVHDSVFVRIRADTVFVDRLKTLYRERIKIDTFKVADTVKLYINKETTKEVEVNRLTGFQHFLVWCGIILIIIIAVYAVYILFLKDKSIWLKSITTTISGWLKN